MATVGDWSNATLATNADVIRRYPRAEDLTGKVAGQKASIDDRLTDAKAHIGRILQARLREKIIAMDLAATVEILDYISNPEVFKEAAVAWALYLMFEAALHSNEGHYFEMKDAFFAEFDRQFQLGFALMKFDGDNDGAIDQDEAGAGLSGTRFFIIG